ncbi:hypothetical protein FGO68_gene9024 [Halteria grandinella]|uniref:Uncharacterized protein n=1 Tax=Halteria grandinella TaxID=5974 RepID=A0A8J8STZ4_HALGN|nr:hypothetical protein FGO68_gene9024 [Halteria grandinella]
MPHQAQFQCKDQAKAPSLHYIPRIIELSHFSNGITCCSIIPPLAIAQLPEFSQNQQIFINALFNQIVNSLIVSQYQSIYSLKKKIVSNQPRGQYPDGFYA